VVVNVIWLVADSPKDDAAESMKKIVQDNGGVLKIIPKDQF
jgi:hypothetical protein